MKTSTLCRQKCLLFTPHFFIFYAFNRGSLLKGETVVTDSERVFYRTNKRNFTKIQRALKKQYLVDRKVINKGLLCQ